MKISVNLKPGSRAVKIEQTGEGIYRVAVKALARDGQANDALIKVLSEHFSVPRAAITLLSGHTSRHKIIGIKEKS